MENRPDNKNTIQIVGTLKESFVLYKDNFILFIAIILLGGAITLIEQFLFIFNISLGWFSPITMLVGIYISFWAYVALILSVSKRFQNQDIKIKDAFLASKDKIGVFVGVSSFSFLIFITGCLLFIIPGFYLGTIFELAGLIVVLENVSFFDSFKRSKGLIKGYFWPVFIIFWIVFVIYLPVLLLHNLGIASSVKSFLIFFISLFFGPLGVAVTVNVYYKLKQIKGDVEASKEETVKKGAGGLGCLGTIGLLIAILVLSTFWFRNLGGFIRSDKGLKVYEWVSDRVSPEIEFQGNVVLDRPEGYLVIQSPEKYALNGFLNGRYFTVQAFSIPFKDLNIEDQTAIEFGSGEVWDKYYAYLTNQSKLMGMAYSGMERESVELNTFDGTPWVEYKLKEKKRASSKSQEVWLFDYTLTDDSVIFVTYGYEVDFGEEEDPSYSEEVRRILSRFRFQ